MIDLKVSRRYAKALAELAQKFNAFEALDRDFQTVQDLIHRHPEITHLVLNSTISQAEKEDFIDKIFGGEFSHRLVNFIKVLVRKRRFSEIRMIQEEFHRLFEKKWGIQEVVVLIPVPLSDENEQKLQKILQEKMKVQVRLKTEVQSQILGGMILRFDGKEVDMSFRNRLMELRQRLTA